MFVYSPFFIIKAIQESKFKKYACYLKGKALDVGCGTKEYKKYLTGSGRYVGMDMSEAVGPDILGNAQDMPFSEDCFDTVICAEVLEHCREPEFVVRQIRRVLKKEGYLYLSVPQEWCLHYEPNDYFRFTKYGIRYLLEKNDFRIIAIERVGGIFSLLGQRVVDVGWQAAVNSLGVFCGARFSERFASFVCMPLSLFFYLLGRIGDAIDKRDALGWVVLARK